jgi:hypothetical protein
MLKVYLLSACCLVVFVLSIIFLSTHTDNNDDNKGDNKGDNNKGDNKGDNKDIWTDAQKMDLYNTVTPSFSSTKECVVNAIVSSMSYNEFKNQPFDTVMSKIIQKVPCFGTIGEWTNEFKNFVINHFPKKLNAKCSSCIINNLEKIVEPDIKKIMHSIQNDYYMTNLVLQNCKHECT